LATWATDGKYFLDFSLTPLQEECHRERVALPSTLSCRRAPSRWNEWLAGLQVSAVGGRLRLVDAAGQQVSAISPNIVNTYFSPEPVRLLDEIADDNFCKPVGPNLSLVAQASGGLPRVWVDDVVVSRAGWCFSKDGDDLGSFPSIDDVRGWRLQRGVPRHVWLSLAHRSPEPDARLPLDLENPISLAVAQREIAVTSSRVWVFEAPELDEDGRYMAKGEHGGHTAAHIVPCLLSHDVK
jgi:hypothetical protein